jgi:hypothetical protein
VTTRKLTAPAGWFSLTANATSSTPYQAFVGDVIPVELESFPRDGWSPYDRFENAGHQQCPLR